MNRISFIDLQAQRARIHDGIDAAIAAVLEHGQFVMGPEVEQLEARLAHSSGARYCVTCASGTDALSLPLMAWGIGRGDAVFCPSFTFAATAEIVPSVGASPVFVDIDPDHYLLDTDSLKTAIKETMENGELTPRAIIAVDLFGMAADYPALRAIADEFGLKLIADSAQGFGCRIDGQQPSHWADIVTTSFFPAKPLGCYGDGGAIMTDDEELARLIDSIRVHGRAVGAENLGNGGHDPKYLNMRVGMNSRLDTIQAAILLQKLEIFDDEIVRRNELAAAYGRELADLVENIPDPGTRRLSVWAQYTVQHPDRDALRKHLDARGVPTAIYYPVPMHMQPPYAGYPVAGGQLATTEYVREKVISLPMHPWLETDVRRRIVDAVATFA